MKKIIVLLAFAGFWLFSVAPAIAAETAVSAMPSMTATDDDELVGQESGETVWNKIKLSALATYTRSKTEQCMDAQVIGYTANVPAGTDLYGFRSPYTTAFTVTRVFASYNTAPTTDAPDIDINEAGTTILSTKITVDATENYGGSDASDGSAVPAVISDSSIAARALITIDVDDDDNGNTGTGLYVAICGYPN